MEKKRVLIFPAGTEIAFEIQDSLKYSKYVELFGANSIPSHAEFVFKNLIKDVPYVTDEDFIFKINLAIDKYKIDYIYPAHDSVCLTLTQVQDQLHAKVVTSPLKTVEICRSKNKTYEYFKGKTYIPKYYTSSKDVDCYPVFIKPTVGQGAVGARKIEDEKSLLECLSDGQEYAICEYLPGNEYTVDCFTDKNGNLRVVHLRQRERIRTGISVRSSLIYTDNAIRKIAEDINCSLTFNGAWFFQVKKNMAGEYRLMEISPRIPGTMAVSRNLGINFPLLTLYNMWGYDVEIIDNGNEITLDRAFISRFKTNIDYDVVYMDFDDTLYIDNKVNILLMAFLYQCVNKKKKIVLITKHIKDLQQTLIHFKISKELFDEIIHLNHGADKSEFITNTNAIFIDDSFAERQNINQKCGIPVFDLDMIESLIDWRM